MASCHVVNWTIKHPNGRRKWSSWLSRSITWTGGPPGPTSSGFFTDMATFSELLTIYINRAGITDSELARSIGVRRQTIFRWKEGVVARPRHRDDVLRCAERLRLSDGERDGLLMSAGFAPEMDEAISASNVSEASAGPLSGEHRTVADVADSDITDSDITSLDPIDIDLPASEALNTAEPRFVHDSSYDSAQISDSTLSTQVERAGHRRTWIIVALSGLLVVAILAVILLPDLLTSPTPVPTSILTPTPQASTPLPPTATPIVSGEGETLVLVGEFANYSPDQGFNVAGRLQEALVDEIAAAELISTTAHVWPQVLSDPIEAQRVLGGSHAAMLIWGEYDSGRVRVNLSTADASTDWEKLLPSPAELSTTINLEAPHEVRLLAVLTLGKLYRKDGDTINARGAFRRVLELQPGEDDTVATAKFYLATVMAAEPNPDYPYAVRLYDDVIAEHPDWINVRYNRGTAYLKHYYQAEGSVDDLDAAIIDFTWVVEKRPSYADAHLNRGIAFYERNGLSDIDQADIDLAVIDLDKAVELSPTGSRAAFNRGLARLRRGDDNWADDFEQILVDEPVSAGAYNALCWGYALEQRSEQALVHCDVAIELGLTDTVYDGRGIALAQLGRYDEATVDLTNYLETLKSQSGAAYNRLRGPLVEEWIVELEAGQNPFDEETLEALR
jgi:tetratricopeptide (TPR) repeat protein